MKFKKLKISLGLLILFLLLLYAIVNFSFNIFLQESRDNFSKNNFLKDDYNNCVTKTKLFEVHGNSLVPFINPGQVIKLAYGYYNCHPVKRKDIIVYKYAGHDVPIIKIISAIPGDKWYLEKDNYQDSYRIIVNDMPLKNSEGKYYQIYENKIKMLKLYAKSYPIIPDNTYLILGNKITGSLDATQFGLISKSDITGKATLVQ